MPDAAPPHAGSSEPLDLTCPVCGGALRLQTAHIGIEGFCPMCQTPIVARRAPDGAVTVHGLFPTLLGPLDPLPAPAPAPAPVPVPEPETQPLPPSPPAPIPPAPIPPAPPQAPASSRDRAPERSRGGFLLWISGLGLLLVAAAVALHFSRSPEPAPLPAAAALPTPSVPAAPPEESPAPPGATAAAPTVPPEPVHDPEPASLTDPESVPESPPPGLAESATATIRDFLDAARPWEKLLHVLEPEEDLLSILAFQELAPVSPDTEVRHRETRRSAPANGNRWVSHLEWTESDGTVRPLVVVHRDGTGTASRFDFSLYWQNRSDVLTAFRDRPPLGQPLEVRVLVRRGEATDAAGSAWELSQPDTTHPAVSFVLDAADPVARELSERIGPGDSVPALLELTWRASAPDAPQPTISRVIRWGWWPAWEGD